MLKTDTLCLLVKMLAVPSCLLVLGRALTAIPKALTLTFRNIVLDPQKLPSPLSRSQKSVRERWLCHVFPRGKEDLLPLPLHIPEDPVALTKL